MLSRMTHAVPVRTALAATAMLGLATLDASAQQQIAPDRFANHQTTIGDWSFLPVISHGGAVDRILAVRDQSTLVGNNIGLVLYVEQTDGSWQGRAWPNRSLDDALTAAAALVNPDDPGAERVVAIDMLDLHNHLDITASPDPQALTLQDATITHGVAEDDPFAPALAADDSGVLLTTLVDIGWPAVGLAAIAHDDPNAPLDDAALPDTQTMLAAVEAAGETMEATGDVVAALQDAQAFLGTSLCWRTTQSTKLPWSQWQCEPWQQVGNSVFFPTISTYEWQFERRAERSRTITYARQCWNCNLRTGSKDVVEEGWQDAVVHIRVSPGSPAPPTPAPSPTINCLPTRDFSKTETWNPSIPPC